MRGQRTELYKGIALQNVGTQKYASNSVQKKNNNPLLPHPGVLPGFWSCCATPHATQLVPCAEKPRKLSTQFQRLSRASTIVGRNSQMKKRCLPIKEQHTAEECCSCKPFGDYHLPPQLQAKRTLPKLTVKYFPDTVSRTHVLLSILYQLYGLQICRIRW